MRLLLFFLPLVFMLFIQCSNDDSFEINQDEKYFPLVTGMYWIYAVEKTEYSLNGDIIETAYQTKITVIDSSKTGEDIIYFLKIEKRTDDTAEWEQTATWESYKNRYIAVLNKGSLPKIKLSFPVEQGKAWNGNALNALDENVYFYDSLNRSFGVEDQQFENTVTVVISVVDDEINITADDIEYEVYAKKIGLIFKSDIELSYKSCSSKYPECCESGVNICFDQIVEGSIINKKLVEFGTE